MSEKEEAYYHDLFNRKRVVMIKYIIGISVVVIGIAFLIGYVLDLYLDKKPFFTFALVIVSFPVDQFIIYKILKNKI